MHLRALSAHLVALSTPAACASPGTDPYRERNGKAEAFADYRRGARLKIYSHISNGFVPGSESPGLAGCSPAESERRGLFIFLPEAAFQEGAPTTPAQDAVAASAIRFARDYNLATLGLRKRELQALCPQVRPAPQ